jgi:CHAP domain/IPT/TIG domain
VRLIVVAFLSLMISNVRLIAQALPCGSPVGTPYEGISAYSNGKDTGIVPPASCQTDPPPLGLGYPVLLPSQTVAGQDGEQYQCVELIRRFYRIIEKPQSPPTSQWYGDAQDFYPHAAAYGLTSYPNGGTSPPQPDDIVAFSSPDGTLGHVAIVREIDTSACVGTTSIQFMVELIEQNTNWSHQLTGQCQRQANGKYTYTLIPRSMPIKGWLRLPFQPPDVTEVSPSTIIVGSFKLSVTGNGFVEGAQVFFGSTALTTTFVSPTQLTATGTATTSQVGIVQVTVTNPGTTASNAINITVSNVSAGNSGSTGVIAGEVNGQVVDKAYVPLLSLGKVAVLNADATSSTSDVITSIPMPSGYSPNATAANQATQQVVVISYSSPDIQIIDASQDSFATTLNSPVTQSAFFSGGSCMICGVLVDTSTNSAILDTSQGYLLLNLATNQFSSFMPATVAGENFGYNPNTRIVLNPTYYQGIPAGLQAIGLTDNSVSSYTSSVGSFPDAAAVDINTNIGIIPDEFTGDQYLINMGAASFSSGTFLAPSTKFPINFTNCGGEQHDWSLVSAESSTHLLFLGTEFADCAAVEPLPSSTISGAPPLPAIFHWGHMPLAPDGSFWINGGDPHGIAAFTSVVNGKAYGFLINISQSWVARIDLAGVRDASLKAGGLQGEVDPSPFVTFLRTQ